MLNHNHDDLVAGAKSIITAALEAADPARAIRRAWTKSTAKRILDADATTPVLVLAIGKSSLEMASATLSLLPSPAEALVVIAVPERVNQTVIDATLARGITILPADHPLPTDRNITAARAVRDALATFSATHGSRGLVIALISGGGSAHLTLPADGLTLEDLRDANRLLQNAGASIRELNAVRKHTELLKGGRLAQLANSSAKRDESCDRLISQHIPAEHAAGPSVVALVASDVIGDPLDVIASGPFAPDPSTFADALTVLNRFRLRDDLPAIAACLQRGMTSDSSVARTLGMRTSVPLDETPKPGDRLFGRVHHEIISSNAVAMDAASDAAARLGFHLAKRLDARSGSSTLLAAALVAESVNAAQVITSGAERASVVLLGGEPTVDTRDACGPPGIGGPSQELALAAAVSLSRSMQPQTSRRTHPSLAPRWAVFAFSTDGIDGPTDAAGAIITDDIDDRCRAAGLDPAAHLARHDSYTLLDRLGLQIRTGPTGVNVNHIVGVLIVA